MATLYFKVSSDWEQVVKLRDEIKKLENQLKSFGKSTPEQEIHKTEERLAATRQEFTRLTTEAAKAGAVMENDLKRKINSATKASDELSEEIIKQRKIIRDTQEDVRRLSEEYSKIGKYSPKSVSTLAQLNRAKAALGEQRYALGELQDQQARNRLELRQLTREYRDFSQGTDKATVTVDALMSSLKRTAAEIGGLAAIQKFGSDVINATGTMQQLHVALSTILQDGGKASALISEIAQFAAKTPFNLEDVASGAKQLLAYGSSAETVVDELSMLGDVAAGLQIPIGQLIYLYGTLRTQGRAMTVDIRQFAGRGIPIYEELAKVLGVAKDQVGELVTAGKVGFKEVEQAFKNMTSEGGKFNDLLENSAGTWPQRMSNIQETLFQKLNDFGNKYKEVFEFGIGTAEDLVAHLDDVISVIGGLIAAYGTYKAALIAAAVAQKAVGFIESVRLIAAYRKELGLATAAQQAFNVAARSNVYVALLSVLVGLGTAIYMFTKRTNEAMAAQDALSNVNKKADEAFSAQAATIDRLNGVLKSETASLEQKKKALSELQAIVPNYNAELDEEGKLINNNTEAIKAYLVQLEKQIRLKAAQEELEELYRNKRVQERNVQTQQSNYDRAREQNPIGIVYGGDAGIEAQRHSLNRIANAEDALKNANNELKNTQTQIAAIEKEIEQTSLSSKGELPKSDITKEIETVTDRIKTLKQEIAGLRSGDLQAEVGKTVESVIEAKTKELQQAEKSLETLTGIKMGSPKQQKKSVVPSISIQDEDVELITPEEIQKNIDLHREMMDKFLADYGTYQQKREAIADMYALKIAQAETEGERLSLQKQMESALKELDFDEFKGSINFADIFGNLDEQTTDALRVLRDKLASYINQAAKELRPEDLKELQDAFSKLDLKIAERDPWEEMKSALQEYRDALREVNEAKEESISKTESQAKAEGKLQAAEQKRMKAFSKLTTATNSLGEQGIQVVNMGNQLVDMLSSFGVEVPEAVSGALDGLGQVMNGLANLDFSKPFSIITSAVSVFTGLGKTIGSLFGIGGADYSGYEEMRSQYEALLSVWDDLIAKKKEYINISYGAEAIKAAEEVQQMLDTELRTYRQLADQLLASGAGIGSHSLARRIEDRMTAEDWARVSGLVGTRLSGNAYDLFDLDPSVIGNVLNDEKTVSVLNEVNPELVEYIKNIASYEEGVNEVTDALKESLTGVSFDEFQNSFADMMSDLDATNEDFADNLEKYLQKAIFSSLVANQYKSRIQKLYNQWSDYAESDNNLTSDEANKIRQEYNQIVNDMLADRNQIMETMGWQAESSSQQQQASRGYSITASQESIDETNGRLTGIQMGVEEMKNQATAQTVAITQMKGSLDALAASSQKRSDVADEVRSILAQSYLELQEIRENTGAIVAPIRQIQKDIAEVKQNTARI